MRHGMRQGDLAEAMGYEQTYISALEIGSKGPPTDEFIERAIKALQLGDAEQADLGRGPGLLPVLGQQRQWTLPC